MSEAKNTTAGCVPVLLATPIAILIRGWSLKTLWLWFVCPQFDLAPLPLATAYGLSLVLGLFVLRNSGDTKDQGIWESILESFTTPLAFVAFGWVVLWVSS